MVHTCQSVSCNLLIQVALACIFVLWLLQPLSLVRNGNTNVINETSACRDVIPKKV